MPQRIPGLGIKRIKFSEVTVGCDPEFELVNRLGNVVSASGIVRGGCGQEVEIGTDGSQVEFRPRCDTGPIKVVTRFKKLLKKFSHDYHNHSLRFTGNDFAIGGHIHIGHPALHNALVCNSERRQSLCRILDDFVGDKIARLNGRARGCYAGRGQMRMQEWGIEYRACPAAVFASRELLRITMVMIKGIVTHYLTHKRLTYQSPPTTADYRKMVGTKDYATFVSEIQRLENAIQHNEGDLLAAWKIPRLRRRRISRSQEVPAPQVRAPLPQVDLSDHSVVLHTSDDWNPSTGAAMRAWARNLHCESGRVSMTLFGLAANRGAVVAGLELEGYETIEHNGARIEGHYISIGLAYDLRMTPSSDVTELLKAALLRKLNSAGLRVSLSAEELRPLSRRI